VELQPGKARTLGYGFRGHRDCPDPEVLEQKSHEFSPRAIGNRHETLFSQAAENGARAREAFRRCRHYVDGWLARRSPDGAIGTLITSLKERSVPC